MWTCLASRKASRPSVPSSRPIPEFLKPPKGPASLSVSGSLIQTDPARTSLRQRIAVLQVPGVDVRAETEVEAVGILDRFVEVLDRHDRGDRPEGLLGHQVRFFRHPGQHAGLEVVALLEAGVASTGEQFGTGGDRRLDLGDRLAALDGARPSDRGRSTGPAGRRSPVTSCSSTKAET